jgi:Bacterial protein of unknown function (DUF937)
MATIPENLTQTFSPTFAEDLGLAIGYKPDLVSKGLAVAGPLLTAALANRASTPSGATGVFDMLPQGGGSSVLQNLSGLIRGGGAAPSLLSAIFGSGSGAISGTLDRALNFKASRLLAFAAPVVLAIISKVAAERKLNASGVAQLLETEAAEAKRSGGENARIASEALDAGRQASETIGKYSAEQWTAVRLAPVAAARMVMLADVSGPVGAVKEVGTTAKVIAEAKKTAAPTSLLGLAYEKDLTVEEMDRFLTGRAPADALTTVRQAVDVVSKNNPSDAPSYKHFVEDVATKVAEASKEGGFLGVGGTRVSAPEQEALNKLRNAISP